MQPKVKGDTSNERVSALGQRLLDGFAVFVRRNIELEVRQETAAMRDQIAKLSNRVQRLENKASNVIPIGTNPPVMQLPMPQMPAKDSLVLENRGPAKKELTYAEKVERMRVRIKQTGQYTPPRGSQALRVLTIIASFKGGTFKSKDIALVGLKRGIVFTGDQVSNALAKLRKLEVIVGAHRIWHQNEKVTVVFPK